MNTPFLNGLVISLLLALMTSACRGRERAPETSPTASTAVKVGAPVKTAKKIRRVRKRLPPPLKPHTYSNRENADHQEQPCALLVNKVCALLSQGAEECTQARARLQRQAVSLHQEQCASALRWYRAQVEDVSIVRPCRLVAKTKCRAYGRDSARCASAKLDASRMNAGMARACKAELLLFKGLP
ncbi:MAG TPA: hypothetical protein EYN66_08510 [Myxococcales bacterium]|nr:hypothetical protein [Myxococcales bacterium]